MSHTTEERGWKYIARVVKVFGFSFFTIIALLASKYGSHPDAIQWGKDTINWWSWVYLSIGTICVLTAYWFAGIFRNPHYSDLRETIMINVVEVRRHYSSKIRRVDIFLEWLIVSASWTVFEAPVLGASLIVFMFLMALVRRKANEIWKEYQDMQPIDGLNWPKERA